MLSILERFDTHNGDFLNDVTLLASMGQIPGVSSVYILGHNPAIPTGTEGVLWPLDGIISASGFFPATAVTAYLSSNNVANIGQTIKITVLDNLYNVQNIGVTLNGTTAVALPIPIRRVLLIENVGTTKFVGNIYVGTEAVPVAGVPALLNTINMADDEDQISHTATYTVPLGFTLFIYEFSGGTPTNDAIDISGFYSNPGTNVFKRGSHLPVYRGYATQNVTFFPCPEKTDIYLSALAYTNNSVGHAHLLGLLIPNKYVKL